MITNHIQICFVYKKNTKCFLRFPFSKKNAAIRLPESSTIVQIPNS